MLLKTETLSTKSRYDPNTFICFSRHNYYDIVYKKLKIMLVDSDSEECKMVLYGCAKSGKWHIMLHRNAMCSNRINIVNTTFFDFEPKYICEKCSKKNKTEENNTGPVPMDLEPDDFSDQNEKEQFHKLFGMLSGIGK